VIPRSAIAPLVLLCLPYAALATWVAWMQGPHSLAAFTVSVGLLMLLPAVAARTWRRYLLLQFPILLVSTAFAAYTLLFDTTPGEYPAYILATTSWREIRGLLGLWQNTLWVVVAMILASFYLGLSAWTPARPMFGGRHPRLLWGMIAAAVIAGTYAAQNSAAFVDGIEANPIVGTAMFLAGPLRHAEAAVNGDFVRKIPYGASRAGGEEVHILVIGESARRDSWSAYGYARKTTPNLEKLRDQVILFQNAVADANFTASAFPMLLTGMSPSHFDMNSIRGNIVDLAREAGYSTAWLMNQDPHLSLLAGVHADRMVYSAFMPGPVANRPQLDESLLPDLRREVERRGKPRFIGLHLIGSHWAYHERYPPAFALFHTDSESPNRRDLDAYDNSIAYTDWILGQIIEQARGLDVPATVTYISDHGEDLYALDGKSGHGRASYTKHQFEIPAFVWVNSAYRAAHPEKVQAMIANADKEIRSHNIFYSVADLMGIRWPGASPSESFASLSFVPDVQSPFSAGGTSVARVD
jgi:glucan phosphoethanolaminetransferase (alkaline phosphatase superfamily)